MKSALLPLGFGLTAIGTRTVLAPSTTTSVQLPAASGAMLKVCGDAPPDPPIAAIPAHADASGVSVPLDALTVTVPAVPPTKMLIVFVLCVRTGAPPPPPTVIPSVAASLPTRTTRAQLPCRAG